MRSLMPCVAVATGLMTFVASGATKPIAQWSFDDPSNIGAGSFGTASLSNHSSSDATAPTSVDGHLGKAYHAVCGSMMLGLSTDVPTGNNPFTWSGWLRPDSTSKNSAYLVICSPITGGKPGSWTGAGWGGWHLRFESATELYVGFNSWGKGQSGTSARELGCTVANTVYNDGKWHHFVVSRDADNLVKVYLDGKLLGSKTITTAVAANSRIRLGTHATNGNYFVGDYDEVKIYDVALTDTEILREYNAGVAALSVADTTMVAGLRQYGDVTGDGTLKLTGLGANEFLAPGALTFGGTYQLYASTVDFGMSGVPNAVPVSSRFDVVGSGSLNFYGDQTVAQVAGEGLCGAVSVAEGKTLSIADTEDAALTGGLVGAGTVAKIGSGKLTLKGETSVAKVAVDAGTLVAEKGLPLYVKGLVGYWRFEDAAAIGRNLASGGDFVVCATDGATTGQVADGKRGKGVSLRKGTTIANALLAPGGTVPGAQNAFTVTAWIRPASNSPKSAYILVNRTVSGGKPGSWSGALWNGWNMRFVESGAKLSVDYQNQWREHKDDAQCLQGAIPATAYNDGQWHHIALTREVVEDTSGSTTVTHYVSRLYFDGKQIVEKELTGNQSVATDARLSIGGQDSSNSFSGDYDEVMVFKQSLSAADIATLAQAKPLAETRLVDEATAHWSFDEIATDGEDTLFADTGAAGLDCHFKSVANGSGEHVECVTGADINGGAAYFRAKDAYLTLFDASRAGSKLVQYGWPTFTISIRLKNLAYTGTTRMLPFCFGDGTQRQKCLRLSWERTSASDPQYLKVLAGEDPTAYALDDTEVVASENAPWTTITLVNNQQTKTVDGQTVGAGVMKVYRDGKFIKEISTAGTQQGVNKTAFAFDLSKIYLGFNDYNKLNGFMVDDLAIFRKRVLSDAEVKRLVLEQAGKTGAPLADAAVSVANGATLKVGAGDYALKSLSGVGAVTIDPHATLAVGDWTGFTGTLSGEGSVVVSGQLPTDLKVGTAVIAETGVVAFAAKPGPGKHVVAKADAFELPTDFTGWKVVVNGADYPSDKYTFKMIGDEFVCRIKGGLAIILR